MAGNFCGVQIFVIFVFDLELLDREHGQKYVEARQVTIDTGIQLANGVFDSSTFLVHVVHDHSNIFAEVAQ